MSKWVNTKTHSKPMYVLTFENDVFSLKKNYFLTCDKWLWKKMLHQSPDRALKIKKIVLEIDKKKLFTENVQKATNFKMELSCL